MAENGCKKGRVQINVIIPFSDLFAVHLASMAYAEWRRRHAMSSGARMSLRGLLNPLAGANEPQLGFDSALFDEATRSDPARVASTSRVALDCDNCVSIPPCISQHRLLPPEEQVAIPRVKFTHYHPRRRCAETQKSLPPANQDAPSQDNSWTFVHQTAKANHVFVFSHLT